MTHLAIDRTGVTFSSSVGTHVNLFVCLAFTTQVEVTVIDGHISRNLHEAPGALGVVVGIPTLVAGQSYFGDEFHVLAEIQHLGRRPLQTGVAI